MRTHLDQCDEFELPGVLLSTVTPERPRWLWKPRLPAGKLVILEGDPDEGKTTLALDWAARVSSGAPMPGSTSWRRPRGVVVLSAEDGPGDTIVPRLLAAGANLRRILTERPDRWPSLDKGGLDHIRRLVRRVRAHLVILDPLAAFIPETVNAYSDHRVRRLLAPLAQLAEETGATIVLIRHLVKEQAGMKRSPKYAGGGSIAFGGAARVELLVGPDPRDPTCKVLARVKGNLAPPFPALAYCLVSAPANPSVAVVEWLGETTHTAAELLAAGAAQGGTDDHSALGEAKDWLCARFAERASWGAAEIALAALEAGISKRTLKRAKRDLRVRSEKEGGSDGVGAWRWVLPSATDASAPSTDGGGGGDTARAEEARASQGGHPPSPQTLGTLGTLDSYRAESSTGQTNPEEDTGPPETTKEVKEAKGANISRSGALAPLVRVRVANCPGFSTCAENLTDDECRRALWRAASRSSSQASSLRAAARRVPRRRR